MSQGKPVLSIADNHKMAAIRAKAAKLSEDPQQSQHVEDPYKERFDGIHSRMDELANMMQELRVAKQSTPEVVSSPKVKKEVVEVKNPCQHLLLGGPRKGQICGAAATAKSSRSLCSEHERRQKAIDATPVAQKYELKINDSTDQPDPSQPSGNTQQLE